MRPVVIDVIGDGHALEEAARFRGDCEPGDPARRERHDHADPVPVTATRQLPTTRYARPA